MCVTIWPQLKLQTTRMEERIFVFQSPWGSLKVQMFYTNDFKFRHSRKGPHGVVQTRLHLNYTENLNLSLAPSYLLT